MRVSPMALIASLLAASCVAAAGLPAIVHRSAVDVYAQPDFDAAKIATLKRDDKVSVSAQQGLWYELLMPEGQPGYVRVNDVRLEYASAEGGDANMRVLLSGKAGEGRVTETAGVRGIDESDLKSASFNAAELKAMVAYRVNGPVAAGWAGEHDWHATKVAYANEAKGGKDGGGSGGKSGSSKGASARTVGSVLGSSLGGGLGAAIGGASKVLRRSVHGERPDLDLQHAAILVPHRGVEASVAIRLWARDVVLEAERLRLEGAVHGVQRQIAVLLLAHDDPQGIKIVHLIELELLLLHLPPDSGNVLDSLLDLQVRQARFSQNTRHFVALRVQPRSSRCGAGGQPPLEPGELLRLEDAKRRVLELRREIHGTGLLGLVRGSIPRLLRQRLRKWIVEIQG